MADKTPNERNTLNENPFIAKREQRIHNQKQISYIVIGAGNRGSIYSIYAAENPSLAKVLRSIISAFLTGSDLDRWSM
jgi:hypothetical protein